MVKQTSKKRGGAGYRFLRPLMRSRYKRPEFIYLDGQPVGGSVILSNHVGTDAPISLDFYYGAPIRFWGTGEMNSGLVKLYKYQSKVYYHEKKHWNLFLSRAFCLIASPLTNIFYSGLDLISTWHDARFARTVCESRKTLLAGESIVIFPEDSTKGYLDRLEGFHPGFVALGEYCLRHGYDIPVHVSYFNKKAKQYIFGKAHLFSVLKATYGTPEAIAEALCQECNALADMLDDGSYRTAILPQDEAQVAEAITPQVAVK